MDTRGPSSATDDPSRRRVLALAGAGGAALAASLLPNAVAHAGHGVGVDPEALHLGESNTAPTDSTTRLEADVDNPALTVKNNGTSEGAGGIRGLTSGHKPALEAESDADGGIAIGGASSGPGFGEADNFGKGNGIGVSGQSGSGTGVEGSSGSGTGVHGHSDSGVGVQAESNSGQALNVAGFARVEASIDPGAALDVTNFATGDGAHGIIATAFGTGKAAVLGMGLGGGAGVSGVSSTAEGFADGGGTGVGGQSGSGTGVEGSSGSGTGVYGHSDSGVGITAESNTGQALNVIGTAQIEAEIDPGVVLSVTNSATGDGAHGIMASTFGTDKPAVFGVGHGGGAGVVGASSTQDGLAGGVGIGVAGSSGTGTGVNGNAPNGVGVRGESNTGIGVLASAPLATAALHVAGRAVFETAGTGVVPAGSNQATVAAPFVGSDSQVIVTLTGNPGNRELRWVQMNTGVGFILHLSPAPPNGRPATPFAYVVLDRES